MTNIKKTVIAIILATLCVGAEAQVKWHTMEEASEASIGERLYFVDFYTTWCGYCKKMDRETFSNATVAKILNTYFYAAKFDAESRRPLKWKGVTYRVGTDGRNNIHEFALTTLGPRMGFPTFAVFRADGTLVQTIAGYRDARECVMILWYFANGDYQRYPFEKYQKIFDKEIRPDMEKKLNTK